jgi:DNA-binding NarL/FixJ family response regulator
MSIRLFICCSNTIFAEGIKSLLENDVEMAVVGTCNCGGESYFDFEDIKRLKPDVVLAEFNAELNTLVQQFPYIINDKKISILLIGDRSLRLLVDRHLRDLISRGVVGILPPSADSDLLKKAIRAVHKGELWIDRTVLLKLVKSMKTSGVDANLAQREREIASHICQGYKNKEIAEKLQISEQTVKSYCNRIYKKLGISDRLQLALYYWKT